MSDWADALDLFEQRLEQFRSVLQAGGEPADGLWPPPGIVGTPLPPELADRARELLARARRIEGELVARRAELPTPRQTGVRHRRSPGVSSFSARL